MFSRQIDIWVADLHGVDTDEEILSVAELGHALFIDGPELSDYVAAHSWMRRRLATYLDAPAREITFEDEVNGRPMIAAPSTDLAFSLSYSDSMAVLGVGFRRSIGVDIKSVSDVVVSDPLRRSSLTLSERHCYDHAVDPVRTFLRFWVRKQALANAGRIETGADLATVDVSGIAPVPSGDYEISDINLGDGFVAAVAARAGFDVNVFFDDSATEAARGHRSNQQAAAAV